MEYKVKDTIQIGEHLIKIPVPKDPSEVYFLDEDKENAVWDRSKMLKMFPDVWLDFVPGHTKINQDATLRDEEGILTSISIEDTRIVNKTYEEEFKRRRDGIFIKIKDQIKWIPGDMWFVLMWCKTKRADRNGSYFDFREFQRQFFILIWYTMNTKHILGLFISKAKKTGVTNLMWLCYLNWATMSKNINLGNMNIKQQQGAKTFRDHFMYAYNGLPLVFKPHQKSKSEAEGIVVFGKQHRNTKKSKLTNEEEDELNTTVMCVATKINAFDVDVMHAVWYDEPPKYESDFGEIYRSNSGAISIQDMVVGKMFLTSYTPEESSPSFIAAKAIFYDSELRTLRKDGSNQTKSKLICHHIPAYQSWSTAFDKWGDCDEQKAMAAITAGRLALKDRPRELLAEKRRYANTKEEAWAVGGGGSVFDLIRLSEIATNIDKRHRESPEAPYMEGKLEWTNPLWEIGLRNKRPKGQFCPVKFVPITDEEREKDERGRLRIYQDVPKHLQNSCLLNGRDEWGNLLPPKEFLRVLGGDPTQHAAASEVIQGSKNCYMVKSRSNPAIDAIYQRIATGTFEMIYFDRPESPDEAYEDLLKLIIYTSSLSIIEANVPTMATNLMAEGLGYYMLVKDKNGIPVLWKRSMGLANESEKEYKLFRTTASGAETKDILEMFVRLYKAFLHKEPGVKSYGDTLDDERFVQQLMEIDIQNTKLFDMFMAGGYTLLADELYSNILLNSGEDQEIVNMMGKVLNILTA